MIGFWLGRGYVAPEMKRLSLILAAFALVLGACERHSWDDDDKNKDGVIDQNEKGTKRLYAEHGKDGDHAADADKAASDPKKADGEPKVGDKKH